MIYAVPLNDRFEKRERDIFARSPPPTSTASPLAQGEAEVGRPGKFVCLDDSVTVVTRSHDQIGAIGRRGDLLLVAGWDQARRESVMKLHGFA